MAFSYKRKITINHNAVGATLTNFPFLFSGTYEFLKSSANGGGVQNASGYDVGFYSDAALTSKLNWETEAYSGTTGAVSYWIQIASLSSTVDTIIYVAWGDTSITTDQSNPRPGGTGWLGDTDWLGVWHLPSVSGGASSVLDSTANARNGTPTATPTNTTGQISGGANFVAASSQYVDLGTLAMPAAITYSAWVNYTSFPDYAAFMGKATTGNANYVAPMIRTTGKLAFYVFATADVNYDATGAGTLGLGQWYHLALTYSSATGLKGYINGNLDGSAAANGPLSTTSLPMHLGHYPGTPTGRFLDGKLDEARWSQIVRPQTWLITEANNQNNPAYFYALDTAIVFNDYKSIKAGDGISVTEHIR